RRPRAERPAARQARPRYPGSVPGAGRGHGCGWRRASRCRRRCRARTGKEEGRRSPEACAGPISEVVNEADVAPALLAWWDLHGRRDLPWQRDPTPYRVWVSEIMLQQTQVGTVARYYGRFLAAFPDLRALADAPLDAALHHWSGLGYYARARNLHRAAGIVRDRHDSIVPGDFAALAELPGIGRSTAGAILALSGNRRHPILDGNVKRVLARAFHVEGWPGDAATNRRLWELADACTPEQRVAHYTQAVMDFGASVCTRRRPGCERCPLKAGCR